MAIYNEILSARYNRALQRLFSMKGPAPSRQLSGEIMPVIPFFFGAENRFLEGWNRYGITSSQAAVAAQNTAFRLRNPKGSNVIAVIEKINFVPGTADIIAIEYSGPGAVDLATLVVVQRFDNRGPLSPTLIWSSGNNVALSTFNSMGFKGALSTFPDTEFIQIDIQEFPILPDDSITIRTTAVNNSLRCGIMWRERALEESEFR